MAKTEEFITTNITDFEEASRNILRSILEISPKNKATLITLSGDLGAGKTTMAQFFGKELGIKTEITSPTFVIQKRYELDETKQYINVFHMDLYRLQNFSEIEKLGWREIRNNQDNIIFIEWAENIKEVAEDFDVQIKIEFLKDHSGLGQDNKEIRKIIYVEK